MTKSPIIKDFRTLVLAPKLKGVFLDLDNCLYRYEPCHHAALVLVKKEMEKMLGKTENFFEQYKNAQISVKKRIPKDAASHSRILYFQSMFETHGKGSMISESLELEDLYWETFMKKMVLVRGARKFLTECKKKKIQVVIVSDMTTAIQFSKLTKLRIDRFVDLVVTSEEAGVEKPDKKIFQLALEKTGLKSSEVVMIGDSFTKDIQGAEALGIDAIQIVHE
jgi:putative hydrolase of the HAD superfamily